ncbi:hypothetical protein CEUSTIGMA_g3117.t1 [Chlamydomonas eustigma]|uniref:Uncharacterized protein n=1 Tax=Chlamydomonas eustigma TaxID=1157962 RepID=A0A250WXV6_9CHLO|nr:hypothetical protein CEUSTIGMA_g3117.t1 [Chlamydomonas eustigma]|eukprot:GAX75674.1 hypothetical protein CEUSTIGMA_g3117.t1 [Chlamydomonas eustigma]
MLKKPAYGMLLSVMLRDEDLALVYESWWKTRRSVIHTMSPTSPEKGMQVLFDRNYEDVYSDPGSPLTQRTAWGTSVLARVDGQPQLLLEGLGASPDGNKPFLDLLDLRTKQTKRIWQCSPDCYETPGSIMSDSSLVSGIMYSDYLQIFGLP